MKDPKKDPDAETRDPVFESLLCLLLTIVTPSGRRATDSSQLQTLAEELCRLLKEVAYLKTTHEAGAKGDELRDVVDQIAAGAMEAAL